MSSLGLTSYAYYWACRPEARWLGTGRPMGAVDLVRRTAALGLDTLQICENVATFDPSDPDQVDAVWSVAEQTGIELQLGTRVASETELRTSIEQAVRLGAGVLRVVPWDGGARRNELLADDLAATLREVADLAADRSMCIAVENYFDLSDAALVAVVADVASPWIGVTLDTANSVGRLSQPLDTARLLAPYAMSVHLKDFTVEKGAIGYRVTGTPLGDGDLDVPTFLAMVDATGREAPLLIELWVDPEPDPDATHRKEDAWVERSVAYAREQLHATRRPAEVQI